MNRQKNSRIEVGRFIDVNGVDQWITIRGQRSENAPILILPGPGAGMCVLAPLFAGWEQALTLAQWDQPRAGVTDARYGGSTPGEFTIARIVRDALAVSEWISQELGGQRLAVLGLSAGTIVGLHMIKQRPELFSAYIGTGQVTNWARQDALSYQLVLERARLRRDSPTIAELESIGPPPYRDTATDAIKSKYAVSPTPAEAESFAAFTRLTEPPAEVSFVPPSPRPASDVRAVATAAYDALRDQIVDFDAERLGLDFAIPIIFLQGESDAYAVSSEVKDYAERIRAPHKRYISIAGAGHSPWLMLDQYLALLREYVLPILSN